MKHLVLFVLACLYGPSLAYKAAVFEHYATTSGTAQETILKNVNEYRDFADKAYDQKADILVFPEYGLTTLVRDPVEYAIEITTDNTVIKELTAIAKERGVYLVVNLLEKEVHANAHTKYYNTNLVFDKSGNIVFKYRKINLFQEPFLTPGAANQTLNFTTDFGVTFGIFTGSDILYQNPSQRVLNASAVTDVIYPTSFLAVMPFYTPLSLQYGYAQANGLNLLAAGYNRPKESRGGSGIYLADGRIAESFITESSSSKPLIQDVPKITARQQRTQCLSFSPFALPGQVNTTTISDFITQNDTIRSRLSYKSFDLANTTSTEVCHGQFCCTFDIIVHNRTETTPVYKLAAYDGYVEYQNFTGNVRICTLLVCQTDAVDSCGARVNSTTRFTKISVKSNLGSDNGTFYRPTSLKYNLEPITDTTFCDNSSFVQFQTLKGQQEVLVFGIFGRTVSAASPIQAYGLLFLLFVTVFRYVAL